MIVRQGTTFHFRRVVPSRLRDLIGRREIWTSLATSHATMARARAGLVYSATEEAFAVAADITRLQGQSSGQTALVEETNQVLAEIVERQDEILEIERQKHVLAARLQQLSSVMAELKNTEDFQNTVRRLGAQFSLVEPLLYQTLGALQEARRQGQDTTALAATLARVVEALPPPTNMPPVPLHGPGPLLSSLVDEFFKHRRTTGKTSHQVIGQERSTVRRFLEVAGDKPVEAYNRGDVTQFLTILRRLPASYGKSPKDRDLTLEALIARADETKSPRVADKTCKRHLSALSQLLHYAVDRGHLRITAKVELVDGHRFKTKTSARNQRGAWTSSDLKALFASPVWSGCDQRFRALPGSSVLRDAKFWLPLLALYQGCRLEEFADLYGRDILLGDTVPAVQLVESSDEATGTSRRLKTASAVRVVPLHPEILRLGFLTYVRRIAPKDGDPVFPDLSPQGKDGKRGQRITRWFIEYRRKIGLYKPGVGMHSFRHTAITRLTNAITDRQQIRHRDFMMGHAVGGSEGAIRYDKGPELAAAAETLALLTYPELDLSHLYADNV